MRKEIDGWKVTIEPDGTFKGYMLAYFEAVGTLVMLLLERAARRLAKN